MRRLFAVLGAAAVWLCLPAVAAPSSAQAFIGQGLVETAGGALTGAAEKVIKSGKFIPETVVEAGNAGGAAAESSTAGVFESGLSLPVLGSVVSFGVGTVVGSEICRSLGIEGCWYFGSDGADPPPAINKGSWVVYKPGGDTPGGSQPIAPLPTSVRYSWYWDRGSESDYQGYNEGCKDGLPQPPSGADLFVFGYEANCLLESGVEGLIGYNVPFRYQMSNRTLEYHATDNPSIPNYTFYPDQTPGEWSKKQAKALTETPEGEKVGQYIAHTISPGTVPDPFQTESVVPNCGGLTYSQCAAKLELEGLESVKNTLGWQAAKLDVGAGLVVETVPVAGSAVSTGAKVTVIVNPDEAGMPALVPEPEAHETYDHYVARLPAPVFVPHRQTVPEAQTVPGAGPDSVLQVTPEPDTRADPSGETDLNIRTNPSDAPPIGGAGGGGSTCDATVGAIDWTPLNQPLGNKFPFGIFGFFVGWIGEWETGEGAPPEWSFTILPAGVFGRGSDMDVVVNLACMAPVVTVCRTVFLFAAFVGLLWFLGTAAAKLQGDSS